MPGDVETDWGEIRDCVLEDATVVDFFGAVTVGDDVLADIKVDGLAVRIKDVVDTNAKTNLLGAVCTALGVN